MGFGSIKSLTTQRMLTAASDGLSRSFERLASGQRINSASDDAAGLAVADNLRLKTRLYSVAVRNINDGFSALNIASGAIDQQTGLVTRLAELAEQSANGSLSNTQRRSLNAEYQALISESGRIGSTTSFNGIALLLGTRDGNALSVALQADISGGTNSQLAFSRTDVGAFSGTFNLASAPMSSSSYFDWINTHFGEISFTTDALVAAFGGSIGRVTSTDDNGVQHETLVAITSAGVSGNGISMLAFTQSATNPDLWENEIDAGDFDDYAAGGNAFFNSSGRITTGGGNVTLLTDNGFVSTSVNIDLRGLIISGATGAFGVINAGAASTAINFTNVLGQSSSRSALDVARQRIEELAKIKGQLGSVQSRLSSALSLAQVSRENTAAAESRIRDVDIAEETSALVANQVRQQLASAVLRQVNLQPKLLLSLLQ